MKIKSFPNNKSIILCNYFFCRGTYICILYKNFLQKYN